MLHSRIDSKNDHSGRYLNRVVAVWLIRFATGKTGEKGSSGDGESVPCTICQTSQTGSLSYFLGNAPRYRLGNNYGFRDGNHCRYFFPACGYGAIECRSVCPRSWWLRALRS